MATVNNKTAKTVCLCDLCDEAPANLDATTRVLASGENLNGSVLCVECAATFMKETVTVKTETPTTKTVTKPKAARKPRATKETKMKVEEVTVPVIVDVVPDPEPPPVEETVEEKPVLRARKARPGVVVPSLGEDDTESPAPVEEPVEALDPTLNVGDHVRVLVQHDEMGGKVCEIVSLKEDLDPNDDTVKQALDLKLGDAVDTFWDDEVEKVHPPKAQTAPATTAPNTNGRLCTACSVPISEGVKRFSMNKYGGKTLCMKCQEKQPVATAPKASPNGVTVLGVSGSRTLNTPKDKARIFELLDKAAKNIVGTLIVAYGCEPQGPEAFAREWCEKNKIKQRPIPPVEWTRTALLARNSEVAEACTSLVIFWDGETRDSWDTAMKAAMNGKRVFDPLAKDQDREKFDINDYPEYTRGMKPAGGGGNSGNCDRCNGTGQWNNAGSCYKCGGAGSGVTEAWTNRRTKNNR